MFCKENTSDKIDDNIQYEVNNFVFFLVILYYIIQPSDFWKDFCRINQVFFLFNVTCKSRKFYQIEITQIKPPSVVSNQKTSSTKK